jgi:hypothetical protein
LDAFREVEQKPPASLKLPIDALPSVGRVQKGAGGLNENQINQIISERREIRKLERQFRRNNMESKMADLKSQIDSKIPAYQRPSNVGKISAVTWPYFHNAAFDFGVNPTWSTATKLTRSFQISQEAAFLLAAIGRDSADSNSGGDAAPLQFEIRDRQSSRVFNDRPVPIQNLGKKYRPTILPTPMLMYPNAFVDVTMTSWLLPGDNMASVGNGHFDIYFFGYRIRVEDLGKVQSTIFGK